MFDFDDSTVLDNSSVQDRDFERELQEHMTEN